MAFRFERVRARWAFEDYLDRLRRDHPQYVYGSVEGRDYLKIWRYPRMGGEMSKSVVAFVDPIGNIYRAESWKKRGRLLAHAEKMGSGYGGRDARRRHRSSSAPTFAKQRAISRKIRILRHEGYPEKQAVAIAYSMAGEARKRDPGSSYHQGTSTSVRHRRLLRAAKEDVRRLVKAKRQGYDVSQELARARAQVAAFNRR